MRKTATAATNVPLLIGLPDRTVSSCPSFCLDAHDGPVIGFHLERFMPADRLVLADRRGITKKCFTADTAVAAAARVPECAAGEPLGGQR